MITFESLPLGFGLGTSICRTKAFRREMKAQAANNGRVKVAPCRFSRNLTLHINCNCDAESRILEYDVVVTEAYSYVPSFWRTFLPPKLQQHCSNPHGLIS